MANLLQLIERARRVSTPLIAVTTPDPAHTMSAIMAHCAQSYTDPQAPNPIIAWDVVRGFWTFARNKAGQAALSAILGNRPADSVINATDALNLATKLPPGGILFFLQAHRFISDPQNSQAVWNLRDIFKADGQTLIMLAPAIQLPAELLHDVTVFNEPLPSVTDMENIVTNIVKAADLPAVSPDTLKAATDALCGLAAFTAEQVTAMSLTPKGLNTASLWDRKRTQIEQTPGLSVWRGSESFRDVKDCDNVIDFLTSYAANIGAVVFIDELEKAVAGALGDSSGVSQEMHGTILSWMQDTQAKGMLFLGHPGTGKSMLAKCAGTIAQKPVIRFDLAAMKNSLVGESNARLKSCLDVVDAVSNGRPLVIATCNKIEALSPELRRRFKSGTFFFDLPSASARAALWQLYSHKFGIELGAVRPFDDSGWTGAEIESCCEIAHDLGRTITEASKYIVPISKSASESITALRNQAAGKFISASYSGVYTLEQSQQAASNVRRMELN